MIAAVLGLLAAASYGSADFLGGLAARRIAPLRVTAIAAASGLVLLALLLLVVPGTASTAAVGWGLLSGVAGAVALALLYACLALGPMSILSPLTAVVSAIVPVGVGLAQGSRLGGAGWAGIALALVAVVLVGFVPDPAAPRPSARGLLMALGAGAGIGLVLVFLDRTPDDSGLVPLVANRSANLVLTGGAVLVLLLVARARAGARARARVGARSATRGGAAPVAEDAPHLLPLRRALWLAVACGVADSGANVLILVGLRVGDLTVMSVLTALYSAATVVLAAVVLRERLTRTQVGGLVLALGAAVLLALD
ncbi:EamA family transporter [Frigoribacterium sp. PvP032]|uniref:EamA family transporter n=1 Tax=Frigoribacterium sp. PvP032 TaxID=2806589 RepID=UPI001AE73355|nr:EamA family transporter [Frigoribacterium sp. PvP032]MBP1189600.1 drug/metabolite transporter (DMT)-like permease [Frigoribacterium sp. PvP032]